METRKGLFGPTMAEIAAIANQEFEPSERPPRAEIERMKRELRTATAVDEFLATQLAAHEAHLRLAAEERYVVDLSYDIPEPVPVLSIGGQTVCSRGNISAVVGEPKCKKTFLCSALVGGALSAAGYMDVDARDIRVLWADTEQSESHVQRVAWRTHAIACLDCRANDDHLMVLKLRELEPKKRLDMIVERIFDFRPDLVVIDGIADLQLNTNDLAESEQTVNRLMKLSSALDIHILSVLHTNLHSDKARGHVGSSLLRKSESVIYVRRVGEVSVVEPQYCRNEPFERFAFRINAQGLPEPADIPAENIREDSVVQVLRDHLEGAAERELLINKVSEVCSVSAAAAKVRVSRALKRNLLQYDTASRVVRMA